MKCTPNTNNYGYASNLRTFVAETIKKKLRKFSPSPKIRRSHIKKSVLMVRLGNTVQNVAKTQEFYQLSE